MGTGKNDSPDSPAYTKMERYLLASNTDTSSLLLKSHLRKYRRRGSVATYKSVYSSISTFLEFRKSRNEPAQDWDVGSVVMFFEHWRTILLEEFELRVKKSDRNPHLSKVRPTPKTHLNRYVSDFRTFARAAGITYLDESDLHISDVKAKDWESIHQCPRKQAGKIPPPVLTD